MPKVSVLIPVYGVERYIERCARSLFEQTYENIEYIFVDDCTKDGSIDILKKVLEEYPNRVRQVTIIHHEKNRGLAAARNTALDASTGEYLMLVDSDDYLRIDAVAVLAQKMEQNHSDVVVFNYVIVDGVKSKKGAFYECSKKELIRSYLLNRLPASMWNKIYRSSFYKETGIKSIEGLDQGEDYVVVPRIMEKAQCISFCEEPLYYYELDNSKSYSNNISLKAVENMYNADTVLFQFFSIENRQIEFEDCLPLLFVRSALFLVKSSSINNYGNIRAVYKGCSIPWMRMTVTDAFLYMLLMIRAFRVLYMVICMYKRLH